MAQTLTEAASAALPGAAMAPAAWAEAESQRLAALYRYGVLDTEPEPAFDAITELAACICETEAALLSLVDQDRLWFKAQRGFDRDSAPRAHAPCAQAIEQADDRPMLVDPAGDPRFASHPRGALLGSQPQNRVEGGEVRRLGMMPRQPLHRVAVAFALLRFVEDGLGPPRQRHRLFVDGVFLGVG